jgi:hypothetical protein
MQAGLLLFGWLLTAAGVVMPAVTGFLLKAQRHHDRRASPTAARRTVHI